MVKPIQRPQTITAIHRIREKAPARRTGMGGPGDSSQRSIPREVMAWKNTMLKKATTRSAILAMKKVLWLYFTALDENSSRPVIAAATKAVQVNGRTSAVRRVTARLLEARPSRRRSTMLIEPTTRVMESTWTDSTHGNSVPLSRIAAPTGVS